MIRRTIPRTRAAACNLWLWSFPSSDVFLTSLKLLGTEPARKVRKSSRAGFPASFGNGFFIQISKKDVERMGLSPGDDVDVTVSLPEMVDYPE